LNWSQPRFQRVQQVRISGILRDGVERASQQTTGGSTPFAWNQPAG
jgi:hypothetical protein